MRWWACVVMAWTWAMPAGHAQWLVMSAAPEHEGAGERERLERALARRGVVVETGERAALVLERQLSRPFVGAPAELLEELQTAAEEVLRLRTHGEPSAAIERGQVMFEQIEPHLAALGRDDSTATTLGRLCHDVVQAMLAEQDRGAARRQLETCQRLVPDFEPAGEAYPEEVRRMRARRPSNALGSLVVTTTDAACLVRVQGRPWGQGARHARTVTPGTYAVQVECDGHPGRVHLVEVGVSRPTAIRVDVVFDAALRTLDGVELDYPDGQGVRTTDLVRIADAAGASRLLVREGDGWRVYWVESRAAIPRQRIEGAARTRPEAERMAAAALRRPLPSSEDAPPPPPVASSSRRWVAGLMLSAVALGGSVAGWLYRGRLEDAEDALETFGVGAVAGNPEFSAALARVDERRRLTLGLAGAAGGLLLVGLPMTLPRRPGVPWWSWLLGAAGAGVTTAAVVQLLQGGACIGPGEECLRERRGAETAGALLLGYGAALLMSPLVYLVRGDTADVGVGAGRLRVRWRF